MVGYRNIERRNTKMELTQKENSERIRLKRKVESGKASRKELMRAIDLEAKKRHLAEAA